MSGMTKRNAFTLIELLVVVLIIGILAAVAVPQYQKAVIKTRYAALKNMVHSIVNAQEIYYLANNTYSARFDNLDIEVGGSSEENDKIRRFDWGYCEVINSTGATWLAWCQNKQISMRYQVYFPHSEAAAGVRDCVFLGTDTTAPQYAVCKAETGGNPECHAGVCEKYY